MRLQRLEVLGIRLDSSFLPLPGASGLAMRPPPVEYGRGCELARPHPFIPDSLSLLPQLHGPNIKTAIAILNCLLARQLCFDDASCSAILEIIPRVCGPELGVAADSRIKYGHLERTGLAFVRAFANCVSSFDSVVSGSAPAQDLTYWLSGRPVFCGDPY
ncbi:Glial cell line-derived neurotrophic family receptor-like [Carabus blaptoides fortunei]